MKWHVRNNMTGDRVSRDFDTWDKASSACASFNVEIGSGGLYGVYDDHGNRAELAPST